ncbi:uncharacterized protein LOC141919145 [Strix aluco]|uniref:uncharacterized protein LOC141919145 n=1 Tax=Strix aluco TaxID=111821 RepID=UPI003DA51A96
MVVAIEKFQFVLQQKLGTWEPTTNCSPPSYPRDFVVSRWVVTLLGWGGGQLLAHFHCMSCDRPLSMLVPGPLIVPIPYMPPLPPHLAGRSHTVLEMEQTPQHSHRERVAECGYPRVLRRCGGRHTLTHPLQRCPRPQPHPPGAPRPLQPPTLLPIKHDEMELLGQDGHIYRGRQGGQLPVLVGKEGTAGPRLGRGSGGGELGSGVGRVPAACQVFPPMCSPWLPPAQLPLLPPARLPQGQAQAVPEAVGCQGHQPPALLAPERCILAQPARAQASLLPRPSLPGTGAPPAPPALVGRIQHPRSQAALGVPDRTPTTPATEQASKHLWPAAIKGDGQPSTCVA